MPVAAKPPDSLTDISITKAIVIKYLMVKYWSETNQQVSLE